MNVMNRADYATARSKAAALLKQYKIDKPPIDPEAIAEAEGIEVLYVDFNALGDDISGLYDFESNKIFVNKHLPDNRKTFTIAHELAHALLHKDYAKSEEYRAMPRSNFHWNKPAVESEADVFAACLLVPKDMLRKYREYASYPELARMFAVSDDVVTIQSKYL